MMSSNYGVIEPDSWGAYLSLPELQQAVRLQPGESVSATPMPMEWIPSPDTVIWRYMDFFKFMSLVNEHALFFTRVDKLREEFDEFEGTWSDATIQLIEGTVPHSIIDEGWRLRITDENTSQEILLPLVQTSVDPNLQDILDTMHTIPANWVYFNTPYKTTYLMHRPSGYRFGIINAKIDHQLHDALSSLKVMQNSIHFEKLKLRYKLVNCWHMNEYESDVMWSRYTNRNGSIAIKTDVSSLVASFVDRRPNAIGHIQYIPFETDVMPVPYLDISYWFKRIQFEADRELRIVMDETVYLDTTKHTRTPDYSVDICHAGLPYKVDLQVLIREIVVGPGTDNWKFELIQSIAQNYGLDVPVKRSSLRK